MKKILSIAIVFVFALSMMTMATFTASAETTLIYKFTFEEGGDTILVKAGEPVGEIVEFGAAGNHALKYTLDSVTHTGAGVHPYIWPAGINGILVAQGDLGAGETYELTISIAVTNGITEGSYMYPFMLCNGELDNENYFDRSSFSPSSSFQTYTFVLSSLAEGVPLQGQESGGIAFVDELTLDDGCDVYIDDVTFVKKGAWKPLEAGAGIYYRDGTPVEEGIGADNDPLPPVSSDEPSVDSEEPSVDSEVSGDVVAGDANGDGSVDMKDVLSMRKVIANMGGSINEAAADVNGDGSVDMKDVLTVRKFIAGMIESL